MRRRLRGRLGEEMMDPLQGVANLFDLGVVFALGFLIALMATTGVAEALKARKEGREPARRVLEAVPRDGKPLERFRETDRRLGGQGVKLGTAWRLSSGEVVYVPDGG